MKANTLYTTLCLSLLIQWNVSATDPFDEKRFIRYTTLDGLSDNAITGLMQDEKGFIWITTKNGLNRFDGYEFRKFYQTADPQSLIIDEIPRLAGVKNQLLFITRKGCQSFHTDRFQFASYSLPETESGHQFKNAASDGVITKDGDILMSSPIGFYVFSRDGRLKFRYDKFDMTKDASIAKSYGRNIVPLRDNLFLHFVAGKELFIYDHVLRQYDSVGAYRKMLPNLHDLNQKVTHIRTGADTREIVLYNELTKELLLYDPETDTVTVCKLPEFLHAEVGWRSVFFTVNDSTVIISARHNGLYVGHRNVRANEIQFNPTRYLADFYCNTIFKDKEGAIWIGAENGLLKQNLSEKRVGSLNLKSFSQENDNRRDFEITGFIRYGDELYVGTYSRECIYVLDANDLTYRQRISFAAIDPKCNQVWHILPAAKDTLWFATQGGLLWLKCSNKHFGVVPLPDTIQPYIFGKPVSIAFRDSYGLVWLRGAWGTGLIKYNPKTKDVRIFQYADDKNYLPIQTPDHIAEDKEGNIWLASIGITRWNRKTDTFDTLISEYIGLNKKNPGIRTLTTDLHGNLVFSNLNNGVVFFDPKTYQYNHLTTEQGLPENAVHALLVSQNGITWIGCRNYLSAYDQRTKKIVSYTFSDGVPLEGSTPYIFYHDTLTRQVLTGYSNTYMSWSADSMPPDPDESIPFFIDEISIVGNRRITYPGKALELTHLENDIRIHLAAINFYGEENNQFYYRMNDAAWIPLGKLNSITFNNMTPGEYSLKIKVSSPSHRFKDAVRELTIVVKPPFWKTLWFYLASFLLVACIVFAFVKNRIRMIRKTSELNNSLTIAEMKALHAQMNPHFIFNSLNSIKEMILQNEKDNASRYLSRFAQLIRMNLDHSRQDLITLEQNVQYLERYLEIEKLRFDDFTYSISVDEGLDAVEIEIPPMLLQPLVENALWHGLKPKKGNKEINIRFLKREDQLLCEIEDNGIGINQSLEERPDFKHQSFGINNIRERIELLNSKYQKNSQLEIIDFSTINGKNKNGTLARLTFSLNRE